MSHMKLTESPAIQGLIAPLALDAMQRRMDANMSEAGKTEYIERLRSYGFNTGKSA